MKQAYINGNIYTMNNRQVAQAMIVDDGIITSIGTNEQIQNLLNKNSNVIDLGGHTVLPGLIDSHLHNLQTSMSYDYIDLAQAKDAEDIVNICREKLDPKSTKWLLGKNWNQNNWETPGDLTIEDLDKISTDIPIALTRVCIHLTVINSKALELLNEKYDLLDENNPRFVNEIKNYKQGLLKEKNQDLFLDLISPTTKDEIKDYLVKMNDVYKSLGVTSIQSDDFSAIPSIDFEYVIQSYQELVAENKLTYKIYQQCALPTLEKLSEFVGKGYKTKQEFGNYRLGPLKLYLDGSLGAQTALINNGYKDANTFGLSNYTDKELQELITYANEEDLQVVIHAIGDQAAERILNAYTIIDDENPNNIHRDGIIHAQITTPRLIDLMARLDINIYAQPIFVATDRHIVKQRIGEEKTKTSYAFNEMIKKGMKVGFSTDAPVENINPFENIYSAVTRKDPFKPMDLPFQPEQKIDLYTALESYTITNAYLSFEEDKKGSLAQGKAADFIIIDRDIFNVDEEEIKDIKVLRTILDGNLIYSA